MELSHADLSRLRSLPEGSDSWSAHRPSEEMIEMARMLASRINQSKPAPAVAAGTNGTIQMRWHRPGAEVSFFVYPDRTIEYLYSGEGRGRKSGVLTPDLINELLAEF